MSIVDIIMKILKAIFGIKEEEIKNTSTVQTDTKPYTYMSEDVKDYLLSGHSVAEQKELLKQIEENEAAKNEEYQIKFDNGYYYIRNGQIVGCAKYKPKEVIYTDKLSPSVRLFVLAGHKGEERESIEKQIDEAEAKGLTEYTIDFSNGYYKIKDGQVVGGAKGV